MKTNKMQWNRPELLVLTRSNPEEAVLVGCKNPNIPSGAGPTGTGNSCKLGGSGDYCNQATMS